MLDLVHFALHIEFHEVLLAYKLPWRMKVRKVNNAKNAISMAYIARLKICEPDDPAEPPLHHPPVIQSRLILHMISQQKKAT